MDIRIRPMEAADREAVLAMMRVFYASPAVLSNGSEQIFQADVDACLGDSPYLEGYVWEGPQGLCGYSMLARSFSTEFGRPCLWVEDLYLLPEYRGQGLGSSFLRWLGEAFPKALLRLEAEPENTPAIRAYQRSGFRELPYLELFRIDPEQS